MINQKISHNVGSKCLALALILCCVRSQAADIYVSTQGSDSNPGTSAQPFRTITRAYSLAGPGTTIRVLPGVYTDYTSGWGLRLGASGTASSPIVLKSQVRGGAVIDGQNAANRNVAVYLDGNYNVIDGFEIRGGPNGGIKIWGNANQIINNEIHHNGNPASTSTNGKDGAYSSENTRDNVYLANYIHDNGRSGSNLDHGLYLCGDNEVVVNNMLVRNAATGLQIAGYTTVSNMKVYNNVVAYNGTSGIILWQTLSGVDIKNNIVYRNGSFGINAWDAHGSGVVFDRNLLFGNGSGDYNFTNGGSNYSYTRGTTISADPLFLSSSSASFDPHLTANSPAIRAGLNLSAFFTTDKDGAARPSSGAWDLGAYQTGIANTPPVISSLANQTVNIGSVIGPLVFSVSDVEISASSLTVSGTSSNPTLVPNSNINVGGTGGSRTVTITPALSQTGAATITVTVSDGQLTSSTSFLVTVNSLPSPVVALTAPANGATYIAPATINLAANVTANGHAITKVLFYTGSVLLGESLAAPYTYAWINVSAGSYALRAVAVYDAGSTVPSAMISAVVANPAPPPSSSLTFASTSGTISAPFSINSGTIAQPSYTSLTGGGRAVYSFAIANPGDYIVSALVNAPNDGANSFFLNIDGEPTDPQMIWDVPITSGLADRAASWRGNGTVDNNQFAPKIFSLAAGTHQLIVRGREGNCQLGTITITRSGGAPPPPSDTAAPSASLSAPSNGATVSGSAVTVSASASDNVGVVGVQFKLDGANLGAEDTTAPYTANWNTTATANGSHVVAAVARDAAGNQTTSSPVTVTVSNAALNPGWVDDAVPAGGWIGTAGGDVWQWVTGNPAPFSGTRAHQSALAAGVHYHYFTGVAATLKVNAGDVLVTYVFLDPSKPPREVMLQWFDGTSWAHAAYWGANLIAWGTNGTASQRPMGALPPVGQWVRLEVPASLVGLEGRTVSGMNFILYDGKATWDYTGK